MDLKGRNFLTLKDFTPEEIGYFLQLSKELKEKKKNGISHRMHEGKNIALIFEKPALEPAAPLKWQPMIWGWALHIWIHRVHRLVRKKASPILRGYWEECSTELSIVDSDRKS